MVNNVTLRKCHFNVSLKVGEHNLGKSVLHFARTTRMGRIDRKTEVKIEQCKDLAE